MEYFVSAENTNYHRWQLDFLIESFKLNNLQDKLVIGIANNDERKLANFGQNIHTCQRIFTHENIGQKRGYLPLNKPYSLYMALENKLITQPFTLIDPDMILVKPVETPLDNILFHIDPMLTPSFVREYGCDIQSRIQETLKAKKIEGNPNYWIPMGTVMTFNNVDKLFFARVIELTETIEFERRQNSDQEFEFSEKLAWVLTILEYHGHLTYNAVSHYEMSLLENKDNNFIHYKYGLPPYFNKKMFTYKQPLAFSMGNLFDILLEHNPSLSTNRFQTVVRSYLEKFSLNNSATK